jgi:hypothetical protein
MFDFLHGQTGVAPNGIELHPVLNIVFNPGAANPFGVTEPTIDPDDGGGREQISATEPTIALDDDGGRVQIVPVNGSSRVEKQYHGGSVLSSVQQVSIFFGSGWGEPETHSREAGLSDLTAVLVLQP